MKSDEIKMNKENYCVNCKHCVKEDIGIVKGHSFHYDCTHPDISKLYCVDKVTGKATPDGLDCNVVREKDYLCNNGVWFEPKISMWTKFVNLFKLKSDS